MIVSHPSASHLLKNERFCRSRYGSCTIPGYDPARPRKPNQDDSLIVEQFQHQSQSFFAVMDGHGTAGHEVARYAKRKLHKRLAKTLLKAGSITQAIDEAFVRTHDDLCASKVCSAQPCFRFAQQALITGLNSASLSEADLCAAVNLATRWTARSPA